MEKDETGCDGGPGSKSRIQNQVESVGQRPCQGQLEQIIVFHSTRT